MNSPSRVITFVNAAHFIDHYAMLIFAAAVIIMGPALGMAYSELLPYATPGFVAFGAGSLITGWLGDRWSRRHMPTAAPINIDAKEIRNAAIELIGSSFCHAQAAKAYGPRHGVIAYRSLCDSPRRFAAAQ